MQQTDKEALFSLGQLVATPGALAALTKAGQTPLDFLSRHVRGEWGELDNEDRKECWRRCKRCKRPWSNHVVASNWPAACHRLMVNC